MAKKGTTRYVSGVQEKRLQKMFGGWMPPNSGATAFKKGDVILEDFYMDGKSSMIPKRQKTVKLDEIEEARSNADYMRKRFSAVVLCFGDERDFFVMEANELRDLYDGYKVAEEIRDSGLLDDCIGDDGVMLMFKAELRKRLGGAC